MERLLSQLDFTPWRIFAGELDLLEFAAVVQASSLNLSGDSGGNHVAWMVGAPSVTWYRQFDGLSEWILQSEKSAAFIGTQDERGILGIGTDELLAACRRLIR